jgi:hypothetical protein
VAQLKINSKNIVKLAIPLSLSLAVSLAYADSLDDVQDLANSGAVALALKVLDSEQQQARKQPARWEELQRERVSLYRQRHDWKHIDQSLSKLPDGVSGKFTQWAVAQRAEALIEQGRGEAARTLLRQLIWTSKTHKAEQFSAWRKLIIRSYLGEGMAADAQIAALRLRQDYRERDGEDYLLRARIALLNRRYSEALELLKPHAKDPTAGALMLLVQLRGQTRSSGKVLQASYRHLREKGINDELRANLWVVAAEAAQHSGNRGSAAMALENVMVLRKDVTLPKSISNPQSDDLWNAYIDYAVEISNRRQLLIGQDKKWLALADSLKKKKPVGSRSLYAFIILRGHDKASRNVAAAHIIEALKSRKHGNQLLQVLFNDSHYFKQRSAVPGPVRHKLVDLALASGNIDLASEIMATIKKPPSGHDQYMWWLRRARILVLGNQLKLGEQALQSLLDANPKLKQLQVERFLQVVFDLQTAGENEAAYKLFGELMTRSDDQKTRREIYYWMADSRKAQERYADAARLYLKSAMYPDPDRMDPWAQTANYQAAVVLAKAGLYQDAKTLLHRLLKVTKDPERRAALQRELQKMWAMQ